MPASLVVMAAIFEDGAPLAFAAILVLLALLYGFLLGRRKMQPRQGRTEATDQRLAEQAEPVDAEDAAAEAEEISEEDEPDTLIRWRDPLDEIDWDAERGVQAWRELAWKLQAAGRDEDAVRALQRALEELEEEQADSAWELHQELGALQIQRQQLREAQQHMVAACVCAALAFGSPSPQEAEALNALGALLEQMGNWPQARSKYLEALRLEQAVYGEAAEETAATYSAIARMCERLADYRDALKNYLAAYCVMVEELGAFDPQTAAALEDVQRAYRADDRDPEAFETWLAEWAPE